ncbi:MAG: hypothetical protein AB3N22_01855, partial [Ruegeria sp.]
MSFLPHAASRGFTWYGSLTASAALHVTVVSAVFLTDAVALLPDPIQNPTREAEFEISLEILDADIIEDEPVEEDLIPPDAIPLVPDALEAETAPTEDLAALTPDEELLAPETDALAPEPDTLAPDDTLAEAPEPDVLEPEVQEPDVAELTAPEPETLLPEPTEPEPVETEPEVAEIEPEVTEPEIAELVPEPTPLAPEPDVSSPLAIDELSPIDNTVLNPLAQGGAAPAPEADPDVLALSTPDVQDAIVLPDVTAETDPVAEPDEDVLALLVPEDDPVTPEEDDTTVAPVALPEEDDDEDEDDDSGEDDRDDDAEGSEDDDAGEDGAEDDTGTDTDVAAAPARTSQPVANPSASDIAIGQLLRQIRASTQPQCTLALPRRAAGDPGVGLSLIGNDDEVLNTLATSLGAQVTINAQTREIIDPRQCATLDALRQAESYPASRIGLALDEAALNSGDTLSGRVIGAGGLFVTLLVVDDNGVVQDLAPFVTLDGST